MRLILRKDSHNRYSVRLHGILYVLDYAYHNACLDPANPDTVVLDAMVVGKFGSHKSGWLVAPYTGLTAKHIRSSYLHKGRLYVQSAHGESYDNSRFQGIMTPEYEMNAIAYMRNDVVVGWGDPNVFSQPMVDALIASRQQFRAANGNLPQ